MSYVPYVPDMEAWKHHFKNYIPSRPKSFYTLKKPQTGDGSFPDIKLVTPTAQIVEQAKASLKLKKKPPMKRKKQTKKHVNKTLKNANGKKIK